MVIKKSIKYFIIVTICSAIDITLHMIAPNFMTETTDNRTYSTLVNAIGLGAIGFMWTYIAFGSSAFVFVKFQDKIPGYRITKGLLYGALIAIFWFLGVVETHSVSGTLLNNEIVMGLCDAIPMLVLGLLLGLFASDKKASKTQNEILKEFRNPVLPIAIFTILYLALRYIGYGTNIISSGLWDRTVATFVWTLIMGIFVGMLYLFLGQATKTTSEIGSALLFGFIIFGVNWISFSSMIPLAFKGTLVDILTRCICDMISTTMSYYILARINRRRC